MDNRWFLYERKNSDLLSHLCSIRGLDSKDLSPDFYRHLHDPSLLPDIDKAVKLIKKAKDQDWFVTIFGDYDADGTPAAALISIVFDRLKIKHEVILPTRKTGYGLNTDVIKNISKTSQLLITVDTGITSVEEIQLAKKNKLKTIIVDHHLPKKDLPPADAVVDPFISKSKYPFNDLCGCALAYKLTVALSREYPKELTEGFCKWLLDLVAISTVSDMMPLIGENRALVHYGLQVLAKTKKQGLIELMKVAGISTDSLNSYVLGFGIGPRFNASGRLSDNRPAYELIKENNPQKARKLAEQINSANFERQRIVKDLTEEVNKKIWEQNQKSDNFIVVHGEGWPGGVLGLVAGKISAQTYKPTVVLSSTNDIFSGSGRSLDHYSLINGLENSSEFLTRFGGHELAAGLSTTKTNLPKFVDSIKSHAKKNIDDEDLIPKIKIDTKLEHNEVGDETVEKIESMAPFGFGNPNPTFMVSDIEIISPKAIGSKKDHLKARGMIAGKQVDIIGFGLAQKFFNDPQKKVNIVGNLEHNIFNGNKSLQLKIKDYRPSNKGIDGELPLPELG